MTRNTPGERWYLRLLRLYPRDFREEFGGEMTRLYRDRRRDETGWSLWRNVLLDLAKTAPSEHLAVLRQDLRHTCRGMLRTPVITAAAVLTLALGVGASTAVFSVVHAVLLRPLPYPEPGRLVELSEENVKTGSSTRASALNYLSWVRASQSFDAIGAFRNGGLTLTDAGDPELLSASYMTAAFFPVLRLSPILGRTLQAEDDERGSPLVVVLNESLWRGRFASDRQIVGRSITLNGDRYQVVGVMPRAFREVGRAQIGSASDAQLFLPLRIDPAQENRGNHTLRVVGRLRRGVTLEQAGNDLRAVAGVIEQEFPATNKDWRVRMVPLSESMLDPQVRRSLLLVLGAVTLVFLIACANVANLLLARGATRQAEFALRTALGAGRSRLVRQLLTESCCLAVVSGAAGVIAAALTAPLLRPLLPSAFPRLDEIGVDATVLGFGVLITSLSGIGFGVIPALRASRLDVSRSLTDLGRATVSSSRVRLRQALVVGEIALATMLLVGAALLLQAFARLQHVPLGFEPDDVVTARISLPASAYPDARRIGEFYEQLVAILQGSGQLAPVAVATSAPFTPGVRASFEVPNQQRDRIGPQGAVEHFVSADYFHVLGVPLLAGRFFNQQDTAGSAAVTVVSQRLAMMCWPDSNPLGQTLERSGRILEVVGIVGDVRGADGEGSRGGGPDREPRAAAYFAASQQPQRTMTILARSTDDVTRASTSIRAAIRELDPALALPHARPLREWFADSLISTRFTTTLATIFSACALLLTSVGIYGVLAYIVGSRTREIGVRMAMGATPHRVVGLVLREGMTWAGTGIAVGLLSTFAAVELIASLLYDIPLRDPFTFAAAAVVVALVALMACIVPAVRAIRIDPTSAMRSE